MSQMEVRRFQARRAAQWDAAFEAVAAKRDGGGPGGKKPHAAKGEETPAAGAAAESYFEQSLRRAQHGK
jgi:hypothetical protein